MTITQKGRLTYEEVAALAERCLGGSCPICNRLLDEATTEKHHLIPKTHGGKEIAKLHKICHRKIHATFTEKQLEKTYNNVEALLSHEDIRKFVEWVADKPPNFYDGSRETRQRKAKRKYK